MKIRLAENTEEEVEAVYPVVQHFASLINNPLLVSTDEVFLKERIRLLLSSPDVFAQVAETPDGVQAICAYGVLPNTFAEGTVAHEIMWCALPHAPRRAAISTLISAITHAKQLNTLGFMSSAWEGARPSVHALYTRLGMRRVNYSYLGVF